VGLKMEKKYIDKFGLDKRISKRKISGKELYLINERQSDFSNDCLVIVNFGAFDFDDVDTNLVSMVGINSRRDKFDNITNINLEEI
jgi:hypothetical protein